MTKKEKAAYESILKAIDTECAPEKLHKESYAVVLEELITDLEGRLDAVNEELEEGDEEEEEQDEEEDEGEDEDES